MSLGKLTKTLEDLGFDAKPCSFRNCEEWYIFNVHNPAYHRGFYCSCNRFFCIECAKREFGIWYQHKYCLKCRCADHMENSPIKKQPPKLKRSLSLAVPPSRITNKLRHTYR